MVEIILTLLIAAAAPSSEDWVWRPGVGFVNPKTLEKRSPAEFLEYGKKLARAGKTEESLAVFAGILKHVSEAPLVEEARFRRGEALWLGRRFLEAYRNLDDFLRRRPESNYAQAAIELEMDSALRLAEVGHTSGILASIPLLSSLARSDKKGVELLLAALQRYPREPFSSKYYYRLAEFYVREEKYADAEKELKFLLTEYKDTMQAPMAVLLLGEIGLRQFEGIDYDIKGLKDARRYFERFVEEAGRFSRLSPALAEYVRKRLPYAREKIAFINDREAAKEYEVAEYYRSKDAARSARIYYRSVVKHYPETVWAKKARGRLKELGP